MRPAKPSIPEKIASAAKVIAEKLEVIAKPRSWVASGKVTTDSAHYDQNIGTTGDNRIADYVRWQETGNNDLLARLYADDVRQDMHRMYFLTAAEAWSDRVAVPSDLLQRARMGGVAHLRNHYYPGNLVSWRFAGPDLAQQVRKLDWLKLIDDETHRAFIGMRTDIDHRPGKTLVAHSGHGKQELPVQKPLLLVRRLENGHEYEGSKTAQNNNGHLYDHQLWSANPFA